MKTYDGSCHCGGITFRATTDLSQLARCNCSMCGRAGTLMTFLPDSAFEAVTGDELYVDYQFGKKATHHGFCRVCGVRPYGWGEGEHGKMLMINVGCLDGVDVKELPEPHFYDGKAL